VRDTQKNRLFSDPYLLQFEKWIPHFNAGWTIIFVLLQ
jgi:hypothetical protein